MKKYYILTYGCQMNLADSEKIAAVLEKDSNLKPAKSLEKADFVVINMCSVRQSAVDRVMGLRDKLKNKKVAVTGCILKKDRKNLETLFDYVLGTEDLSSWPKIINPSVKNLCDRRFLRHIKNAENNKIIAYVPIMIGCNNFCSYCVVPYTRGREVSRPQKEIICEIKKLVKNGSKEIWLLGQNVNSYKYDFPDLLRTIDKIPGKFWIRFTSSHPKDFSSDLLKAMKECKKVTPYLNLPAQSGDDEILKKMNRPYKTKDYLKIIAEIKKEIPEICLSADFIIGFPGETEEQFNNTKRLFEEIRYDMAYVNKYSPRSGTAAFKLKNDVSTKEKKRREKVLTDILKITALESNQKFLEKTVEVLPVNYNNGILSGKSFHYKTVKFSGSKNLVGTFCKIKITKVLPWNMEGELSSSGLARGSRLISLDSRLRGNDKRKLVVIVGPTASGKTGLSIKLSKKYNGEIVSADSRQVYKGMNIGTGKVTKKEMQGVPHYLLDIASPKTIFTVTKYKKLAEKAIKDIQKRNKIPFLVGGTGFYIQAVVDGILIPEVKPDWKLRNKLEKNSTEELFKQLELLDALRAKNVDRHNRRRLIRAIEIILKTKKPIPVLKTNPIDSDVLLLGISKPKKELDKLISIRLAKRLKNGMIAETKKLHNQGISWKRLEEFGLEYRYIALFLQRKSGELFSKFQNQESSSPNFDLKKTMIEKLQKEIEHYAKRQMTWFKKDPRIHWIKNEKNAQNLIVSFLRKQESRFS